MTRADDLAFLGFPVGENDAVGNPLTVKSPVGIPATVSAAELCSLTGVSQNAGREFATRGVWRKVGRDRYDARESIRAQCVDLARTAKRGSAGSELDREKIRVQRETADKLATQNAIARGDLVPVADVKAEWESTLTDVRAAMLAIPSRLPQLDRVTVEKLDREIRAALEALADG